MLNNVSRHCIVLVLEICLIFHVFLNNEKLPFVLELSSNNQMYWSIINVIYSVPLPKKTHFSSTWYSCFCATGSHPSLLRLQSEVYIYSGSMIHSHTNDSMKNFSSQTVLNHILCKKNNKNTQKLSNSSVHLEAIQRHHADFGGQSVSKYARRRGCGGCCQPSHV